MFVIVTIISSLGANICKAQNKLMYYEMVQKAEWMILKDSLVKAHEYYQKAFRLNKDKAFSKDLYNAFHCAMDNEMLEEAKTYLQLLLKRGINSKFLNKNILGYYNNGEVRLYIKSIIANTINDTLIQQNTLNNAIAKLIEMDQGVRNYHMRILNSGAYMVDSTYRLDQKVSKLFLQIIKEHGHVPNQNDLGNDGGNPLNNPIFNTFIIHNNGAYVGGYPSNYFDTILLKAIFTYDYHPYWFVQNIRQNEFSIKDSSIHYKNMVVKSPLVTGTAILYKNVDTMQKQSKAYIEAERAKAIINKNRKKIGLESLDQWWAKRAYMNKHPEIKYKIGS